MVEAATSTGFIDLVDTFERIKALQETRNHPDFEPLVITFKRVANIIASSPPGEVDASLFEEEAEKMLYDAYRKVKSKVLSLNKRKDYPAALKHLARLKPSVDRFFDEVLVMCEDKKVKANRLGLLRKIFTLFYGIADFSKIVTEG